MLSITPAWFQSIGGSYFLLQNSFIMDLEIEFKKLEEGQKQILQRVEGMQKNVSKTKEIYTIDDLAKMFKVTSRTIYNWKEQGILSFVQIGSKTYITGGQIEELLSNHMVKTVKMWRAQR